MILRCPAGHELSSPNWCPTCKRPPTGHNPHGTIDDVRALRQVVRREALRLAREGAKLR